MLGMFFIAGGLIVALLGLVVAFLFLFSFIFWIWMLVNCIRNQNLSGNERLAWSLIIFFTHWIGALIYFFLGRSSRNMPPTARMA